MKQISLKILVTLAWGVLFCQTASAGDTCSQDYDCPDGRLCVATASGLGCQLSTPGDYNWTWNECISSFDGSDVLFGECGFDEQCAEGHFCTNSWQIAAPAFCTLFCQSDDECGDNGLCQSLVSFPYAQICVPLSCEEIETLAENGENTEPTTSASSDDEDCIPASMNFAASAEDADGDDNSLDGDDTSVDGDSTEENIAITRKVCRKECACSGMGGSDLEALIPLMAILFALGILRSRNRFFNVS